MVLNAKVELQEAKSDLENALARQAVDEKGYAIQASKGEGPLYRGKPASYWISLAQSKDADPKFRGETVDALGFFASKNKDVTPLLITYLKDANKLVAIKAAKKLGSMGSEVLPMLLELLMDKTSAATLIRTTEAIGLMGPPAKRAVPFLIQDLKIDDWDVRSASIVTLGQIGPEAKSAIPTMIDVLGIYLNSLNSLNSLNGKEENFNVNKRFGFMSIPGRLQTALPKIEPEIQNVLAGISGIDSVSPGATVATFAGQWQKAYETLRKKYPQNTSSPFADSDLKQELARFEGTWLVIKHQVKSETSIPKSKGYYVFSAKTLVKSIQIMGEDKIINDVVTFDIDPSQSPKAIDFFTIERMGEGFKTFGIYELKDDSLTICIPSSRDKKRPTSFVDSEKSLDILFLRKVQDIIPGVVSAQPGSKDQGPLYAGKPASFWLNQLQDTNPKFRAEAVQALGRIAEKNKELIPILAAALKDKDFEVGHVASNALGDLGPDALPALLEALKEKSSPTSLLHAIIAVGYIGPNAKTAVPILSDALKTDNVTFPQQGMSIWGSAIITLGRIGGDAKPAIPAMIDLLGKYLKSVKDGDTDLGNYPFGGNSIPGVLATALPKIDPESREILPKTSGIPGGPPGGQFPELSEAQWQKAYETLKKKYPSKTSAPSPDAQPKGGAAGSAKDQDALYRGKPASFWLNQLRDTNPEFRGDAVTALGNIAKKNKDLLPVLVEALKDENAGYIAAQFLHAAGPEVMPALLQVLKDKSSPTAVANAINALPSGPEAKVAVPYLTQQLKINDWKGSNVASTCISAVNVLGRIGPDAKPALPAMVDLLGEYLKTVKVPASANGPLTNQTNVALFERREAFLVVLSDAFFKIDPEIGDMLPKYKKQNPIEKTEILIKRWQDAYEALNKKYPTQAAPVRYTPETGKSADSENPLYRGKAASFWLDQFKDSDPKFRAEAVDALGYFAKNNKERVPVLVAYLKDKDKSVAMKAAKVVGSLGPEVLPTLLELLQDKSSTTTLIRGTEAVGWIGSEAKPAVPLLIQELKMADWDLRRASITALSRIGPEAKSALPDMIEVLGIFVNSAAEQDKADMQEDPLSNHPETSHPSVSLFIRL